MSTNEGGHRSGLWECMHGAVLGELHSTCANHTGTVGRVGNRKEGVPDQRPSKLPAGHPRVPIPRPWRGCAAAARLMQGRETSSLSSDAEQMNRLPMTERKSTALGLQAPKIITGGLNCTVSDYHTVSRSLLQGPPPPPPGPAHAGHTSVDPPASLRFLCAALMTT